MLHRASLRADQSCLASCSLEANSKLPPWWFWAMILTLRMFSCTPALVPLNLKNMVGTSFQVFPVAPARLMTFIWSTSNRQQGTVFGFCGYQPALQISESVIKPE